MAFDSPERRMSAMSVNVPFLVGVYPTGDIDQGARQAAVNVYRGILAVIAALTEPPTIQFTVKKPAVAFVVRKPAISFVV